MAGTVLAVVAALAAVWVWHRDRSERTIPKPAGEPFSYAGHPMLGNPDAPVTVVEFMDYKCTLCKRWHDRTFARFKKDDIDTGKVKLYVFTFPVAGPDAILAAEAGYSVYHHNPSAFWAYYDAMYQAQRDESEVWATSSAIMGIIRQKVPGVDPRSVYADLKHQTYLHQVEMDQVAGLRAGVSSTPTFFVNGKMVPGGLREQVLQQAIEAAGAP
ncbi:MAG: DsbA family protein [Alicyclobacillus sp.]|nr:DsbA family protein [Alicyclobacillus sp.]